MNTTSRTIIRSMFALFLVAGSLTLVDVASAGSSNAYPPNAIPGIFDPSISLDPSTVTAGSNFTATVTPCVRGTRIPMTFEGSTINALCTNPHAKATFRAPSKPGVYILTVQTYNKIVRVDVKVISGSGSGVPNTGASGLPLTLSIGLGTFVTGVGLFVVARRRHHMRLAG